MEENKKCVKRAFADPLSATIAISIISKKAVANGQKKFLIKHYKCEDCGEWHLTSQGSQKEIDVTIKSVQMDEISAEAEKRLTEKEKRKKVWIKKLKM